MKELCNSSTFCESWLLCPTRKFGSCLRRAEASRVMVSPTTGSDPGLIWQQRLRRTPGKLYNRITLRPIDKQIWSPPEQSLRMYVWAGTRGMDQLEAWSCLSDCVQAGKPICSHSYCWIEPLALLTREPYQRSCVSHPIALHTVVLNKERSSGFPVCRAKPGCRPGYSICTLALFGSPVIPTGPSAAVWPKQGN